MAEDILIPLIFFSCLFGIVYVIVTARHRQRMAMIEKGVDPRIFVGSPSSSNGSRPLAIGMLMLGLGIGITLGCVAERILFGPDLGDNPGPYFVGCLVCGGIALMLYHRMMEKRRKQ